MTDKTKKIKIPMIAEIEVLENTNRLAAQVQAREKLDAFREAACDLESKEGICLYEDHPRRRVGETHVALLGNISEGFRAVGPFNSFDEAAKATDMQESWILSLEER